MTYDGVPDPKDRADLIAYLKHVNQTPECAR
jgi:cytochrome c